jgi:hypothetical protein
MVSKVNVGDVVLFVPLEAVPIPRGKIKGYTVGVVTKVALAPNDNIIYVVDHCREQHVVFERFVCYIGVKEKCSGD